MRFKNSAAKSVASLQVGLISGRGVDHGRASFGLLAGISPQPEDALFPAYRSGALHGESLLGPTVRGRMVLPRRVSRLQTRLEIERRLRKNLGAKLRQRERKLAKSVAKASALQHQLSQLAHLLVRVQEEERKSLSRDLHDEVVQSLTLACLEISRCEQALTAGDTALAGARLTELRGVVNRSTESVHRCARELRPAILDDLGLRAAVEAQVEEFHRRTGLAVHTRLHEAPGLNEEARITLYRIVQSALTNIGVHARATRAEVCLRSDRKGVCLRISDNGCSFNVDQAMAPRRSLRLGLKGMRERVELIGGVFSVQSRPGFGTRIEVKLPGGEPSRNLGVGRAKPFSR